MMSPRAMFSPAKEMKKRLSLKPLEENIRRLSLQLENEGSRMPGLPLISLPDDVEYDDDESVAFSELGFDDFQEFDDEDEEGPLDDEDESDGEEVVQELNDSALWEITADGGSMYNADSGTVVTEKSRKSIIHDSKRKINEFDGELSDFFLDTLSVCDGEDAQ